MMAEVLASADPPGGLKLTMVWTPIVRLHALIHRRLIVDEGDRMILRGEHLEFRHRT